MCLRPQANVPYDIVAEMGEVNPLMEGVDVALVRALAACVRAGSLPSCFLRACLLHPRFGLTEEGQTGLDRRYRDQRKDTQ